MSIVDRCGVLAGAVGSPWRESFPQRRSAHGPWEKRSKSQRAVIVMQSQEGQEFPNYGVYLEVVKNQKLVFTDASTRAWEPSDKPFMMAILTFEEMGGGGKTRYTALVRH